MLDRPAPPPPKPRRDTKPSISSRQKHNQPPHQRPECNGSSSPLQLLPSRAPPPSCPSSSSSTVTGSDANVDRVLFDNFVEMVPLIETLMGQRANSSFRRRASVIYTPAPANPKKIVGNKSQKDSSGKKSREDNLQDIQIGRDKQDGEGDEFLVMSSRSLAVECMQKDREELSKLRDQLDDLQKMLLQKDEKLKVVENSLNELKREVMEKDGLIKSTHSQLNNAKIKLADKQAALEKLEWEAREANNNNMKLQGKLDSIDFEVSSFMQLFMELSKADPVPPFDDDITYFLDQLPNLDVDESAMEEARMAYVHALAVAKENPCDEMLTLASEARLRLQAFVL